MDSEIAIGICTYNRCANLGEVIEGVLSTAPGCKIVVSDDGSTDDTYFVVRKFPDVLYIRGENKGVAWCKNRALFLLQDYSFICLLEDDLVPIAKGWTDIYRQAVLVSDIHHFCRVQEDVPGQYERFDAYMHERSLTPIYGEHPRGDLTLISKRVLREVGGLHRDFLGAGFAHGEWANRIQRAGLIGHPQKWVDIKEARDCFKQLGDTEGGRWERPQKEIKQQIKRNRAVYRRLKASKYQYAPLALE